LQASGFACDYQPCQRFSQGAGPERNKVPDGWVTVTFHTTVQVAGGKTEARSEAKHFCSDDCLANVAIERHTANTGKRFMRRRSLDEITADANGAGAEVMA
jgi:hypothetical protein